MSYFERHCKYVPIHINKKVLPSNNNNYVHRISLKEQRLLLFKI